MFKLVMFVSEREKVKCYLFSEQNACLGYSWLCACAFLFHPVFVDVSSGRLAQRVDVSGSVDCPCSSGWGESEMRAKEGEMWPFVSDLDLCLCVSMM